MKAFLIDTPNKQIVEADFDGNYKSINTAIHADIYTGVIINDARDTVFVDDEGLINGNPHGWFEFAGYGQPLRGYGYVLGVDYSNGESVAPSISLEELRAKITFPNEEDRGAPESYARAEVIGFDNPDDFFKAMGLI